MEALNVIAPLIGVVLGSTISGIGALVRARSERRKLIGRALSDLLEVRHHIVGVNSVLRLVRNHATVSDEEAQVFRAHMSTIAPLDADIHKRYGEAISLLSGVDPILAFEMRSKNKAPDLFNSLRNIATAMGVAPEKIEAVEGLLCLAVVPALDQAVLKLANLHTRATVRDVKRIVASSPNFCEELKLLTESLAAKSPQGTPSP